MTIRVASVERLIDTILATLIALTFILGFTEILVGVQNGGRWLYASLVIVILLYSHFFGPNFSPKNLERIGTKKPSDELGKQKSTRKPIKPILRNTTEQKFRG